MTLTDDAAKRTPATIIAACRVALNLLDAPAPPPSAEPPDAGELVRRMRSMREHGGQDYAVMDAAADRLESKAARIAELERDNKRMDDALLRLHGELDRAYEQIERDERQLAAAQACIVAADAMREYVDTTNFAAPAAYDAARRAFDAARPGA